MRTIRGLMAGLALVAAVPAVASAQAGTKFTNAWFWGAKAGNMTFWTPRVSHAQAPLFGVEWLLTREKGALLIGAEQAFFMEKSAINGISVNMIDMRRLSFTLLGFPKEFGMLRPYAGPGFSLNMIQSASARGTTLNPDTVAAYRTRWAPNLTAGVQFQVARFSVFGQGTVMWARERFLLGANELYIVEGGIRYNIGSARERAP